MPPPSPGAAELEQPHRLVASLARLVADVPALQGASCYGLSPLWDLHVPGESAPDAAERRALAARICRRCYALEACRRDVADLEPDERLGVRAGEIVMDRRGHRAGAA